MRYGADAEDAADSSASADAGAASTAAASPAAETQHETDMLYTLSDNDIRLLNVFLSNFSELDIRHIGADDDKQILLFALEHDVANYTDAKPLAESEQFSAWNEDLQKNVVYRSAVPAYIIRSKVSRFFGKTVQDQNVGGYIYKDDKYYIPSDVKKDCSYFTNIREYKDLSNGTVKVYFNVYWARKADNNGFPMPDDYKGLAQTKDNSRYVYCYQGQAILKKENVGAGYAPYRVIRIDAD